MREEKRITSLPRMPFSKTVMDPIHGCIQLTQVEYELLQLPALNRLHNIHHLGLAYLVYPAAKTSRFEHSLGVMNIANEMIYQILETASYNDLKDVFSLDPTSNSFTTDCSKLIEKVRLAALLHDVGHGPFSHVSEPILRESLGDNEINEAKELFECEEKDIPFHEYFSYKMIVSEKSDIKQTLESFGFNAREVAELLIKERTSKKDVKILRKIISSQLDADRMDNLLRDSHATGVPFGLTDINRVIHNLFIKEYMGEHHLVVHERALRGVEDILDSRIKMNKSVYSHHLIRSLEKLMEVAIKSMIKDNFIEKDTLRPENFLKGDVDDVYIISKLREYCEKNQKFKPLIDRRFVPVSLIKREGDLDFLVSKMCQKLSLPQEKSVIKILSEKIRKWLKSIEGKEEIITIDGVNFYLLTSTKPFSPYKEVIPELIFIWKSKEKRVSELLEASPYLKAIIEEEKSESGQYFRLSFFSSSITKKEVQNYSEKVIDHIAERIQP